MNKIYSPINWENYPSGNTPINEDNLNKMDTAINELDNRVISQDTVKANKTELSNLIKEWVIDETTGVITLTKYNGEQVIFDLNIEKIPVSFYLDDDGILYMTTDDGTTFSANIGSMIPVLTFNSSDTIAVSVSGTGVNKTYSFSIKTASVTEDLLQPNFLADIQTEANNAELSSSNAKNYATQAQSYAVGGTGSRTGEDTDNAKYYKEQVQAMHEDYTRGQVIGVKGNNETSYRSGNVNLTADDIGAATKEDVTNATSKIQTSSTATISTTGWYRVAEYSNATALMANGSNAHGCNLTIKRIYASNNNEYHYLSLTSVNSNVDIVSLMSKSNIQLYTKARLVYDANTRSMYLEVYYAGTDANTTYFAIDNGADANNTWKAIRPTLTSETLDGVSVYATYNIPANLTPASNLDLAEVQNGLLEVNGKGGQLTTSVLAKALELSDGVYNYLLGGSNYTDYSDLPTSTYRYSACTICCRTGSISVILWGLLAGGNALPPIVNYYNNSTWSGWQTFATTTDLANYLPLTGGTVEGDLSVNGTVSTEELFVNGQSECEGITNSLGVISMSTNGYGVSVSDGAEFTPMNTAPYDLGNSTYRWNNIYASNGTIQTSDRIQKTDIVDLDNDKAQSFIMGLKPSTYKMVNGTSDRTHWGLISQDIEELMTSLDMSSLDFAGFIKSPKIEYVTTTDEKGRETVKKQIVKGEYTYSLRYDEFIAPLIKVVQKQQRQIDELNETISKLTYTEE